MSFPNSIISGPFNFVILCFGVMPCDAQQLLLVELESYWGLEDGIWVSCLQGKYSSHCTTALTPNKFIWVTIRWPQSNPNIKAFQFYPSHDQFKYHFINCDIFISQRLHSTQTHRTSSCHKIPKLSIIFEISDRFDYTAI